MVQPEALQEQLENKVREIETAVTGISDERASQARAQGEWCIKEILSHLTGSEQRTFYDGVKLFLAEDSPEIDTVPGDAYFGASRRDLSVDELLEGVTRQYRDLGAWVGNLSAEQLSRKAHMPAFKETPLGEYPTLGLWVGAIINFHLTDHVQQLKTLCE